MLRVELAFEETESVLRIQTGLLLVYLWSSFAGEIRAQSQPVALNFKDGTGRIGLLVGMNNSTVRVRYGPTLPTVSVAWSRLNQVRTLKANHAINAQTGKLTETPAGRNEIRLFGNAPATVKWNSGSSDAGTLFLVVGDEFFFQKTGDPAPKAITGSLVESIEAATVRIVYDAASEQLILEKQEANHSSTSNSKQNDPTLPTKELKKEATEDTKQEPPPSKTTMPAPRLSGGSKGSLLVPNKSVQQEEDAGNPFPLWLAVAVVLVLLAVFGIFQMLQKQKSGAKGG